MHKRDVRLKRQVQEVSGQAIQVARWLKHPYNVIRAGLFTSFLIKERIVCPFLGCQISESFETGSLYSKPTEINDESVGLVETALAAKFDYLSQNGNSSCSAVFRNSIPQMPDANHIQGSCCSPMSLHRYGEQVEGLKKYNNIPEIPPDPYDIEAGLAKKLMGYYDMQLTSEEQQAYDYAMQNSNEKGPCCCKCWRWYVYGGLGKLLIRNYGFTGEQLTEVWNLSDGCGGDDEHHH